MDYQVEKLWNFAHKFNFLENNIIYSIKSRAGPNFDIISQIYNLLKKMI
jgi:hypothetical protein